MVCIAYTSPRAMACLPPRVQLLIFDRLKRYNCVFSPDISSSFGGVCISSGGCYKQLCDWYYNTASLFRANFEQTTEHPVIFNISGACDSLLANGCYLKTHHEFNKFPVYAQLNLAVVISEDFRKCFAFTKVSAELESTKGKLDKATAKGKELGDEVKELKGQGKLDKATAKGKKLGDEVKELKGQLSQSHLYDELKSKAPNFSFKSLRAGERLLVRQGSGWAVQSVSAFRGHLKKEGDCGFHVLYFPTHEEGIAAKSFAGMAGDMKTTLFEDCPNSKLSTTETKPEDFSTSAQFRFQFGSKRCVECTAVSGTQFVPRATTNQKLHTDGPRSYDASTNMRPPHPEASSASVPVNIRPLPEIDFGALLVSLSALLAFFPFTAVGTARKGSKQSLKVPIDLGRGCVFRFDWLHHGWSCIYPNDSSKLPVHFRAHFYMFNGLLRDLPVEDLESMFEMLSALSHDTMDDGTRLLLLECLQTFVPWRKPTKNDDHTFILSHIIAAERGYCAAATAAAV